MDVAPAAASNPGIPPASLSSFLRVNPTIKGVVLSDHGGPFINPYYESSQDTVDNIQAGSLVAAAVTVAETLHSLASGPATPSLKARATAPAPSSHSPYIPYHWLHLFHASRIIHTFVQSTTCCMITYTQCSLRFVTYTVMFVLQTTD